MRRYIRAFFTALWMTLHGEAVPESQYPEVHEWVKQGQKLLNEVYATAEKTGFNETKRKSISLKLDGRKMSMDLILAGAKHNLMLEYPQLLELNSTYLPVTIQSMNFNDQYRITQLLTLSELLQGELRAKINEFNEHLYQIPPFSPESKD